MKKKTLFKHCFTPILSSKILCIVVLALFSFKSSGQTIFINASSQIPPAPEITDPSQNPESPTNTTDIVFLDVDGDNDLDVFLTEATNNIYGRPNRLLLNDGSGFFTDVSDTHLPPESNAPFAPGPGNSQKVDFGDIDNDGDLDIVVANVGNNELLYNDGNGVFSNANNLLPNPPENPLFGISIDTELADVDNDGDLDILFSQEIPPFPPNGVQPSPNRLLIQQPDGTFLDEGHSRLPADVVFPSVEIETFDVDGDGDLDIIEGNIGQNQLYINDGSGFFIAETSSRLPIDSLTSRDISIADIDGDNDDDLIIANTNAGQNQLYINDGNGFFVNETTNRFPIDNSSSSDGEVFDVDGDGDLDILFANSSLIFNPGAPPFPGPSENKIYLNDGSGLFSIASSDYLPLILKATFKSEIGDLNGDGFQDIMFANANTESEDLLLRDDLFSNVITLTDREALFAIQNIGPIPTTNLIEITLSVPEKPENIAFNLFNMTGQMIRNINISGTQLTLDVADCASGVYLMTLQMRNQRLYHKIIIE